MRTTRTRPSILALTRPPIRALARPAIRALALLSFAVCGATGCQTSSDAPGGTTNAAHGGARNLARAAPEEAGMSSERLERLHTAMGALVDDGRLAGITTLIARHGKVVDFQTYGFRDREAGDSMAPDDIFRIYSMSKPITGVALMILYEEGRFRLSDPVARYIPELANLQVAASWGPDGPVLEELDHPITIRELLTHTAGFAYGIGDPHPADRLYASRGIMSWDQDLEEMIQKLADLPLRAQPGSRWIYSIAVDVQGYLVEVLSGQSFDAFLQERVFGPLGMDDTGFYVPEENHHRLAQVYGYGREGELVAQSTSDSNLRDQLFRTPPRFFSGGAGLVSTTMDYARFCQMLLNGGELDGVRILSPTTVAMMGRNYLPKAVGEMSPGQGFGLDFAVVLDPVEAGSYSVGEYYWGGAAGTWFWIDPLEDLVFVGMIQQFGAGRPDVRSLSKRLTYQAITESRAGRTP